MFTERVIHPSATIKTSSTRPQNTERQSILTTKEESTTTEKVAGIFLVGLGTTLLFVCINQLSEKHYLAAGISLIIGGVCIKKGIDLFTGKKPN